MCVDHVANPPYPIGIHRPRYFFTPATIAASIIPILPLRFLFLSCTLLTDSTHRKCALAGLPARQHTRIHASSSLAYICALFHLDQVAKEAADAEWELTKTAGVEAAKRALFDHLDVNKNGITLVPSLHHIERLPSHVCLS